MEKMTISYRKSCEIINLGLDKEFIKYLVSEAFYERRKGVSEFLKTALEHSIKLGEEKIDCSQFLPAEEFEFELCLPQANHYVQIDSYQWHELDLAFDAFDREVEQWIEHQKFLDGLAEHQLVNYKWDYQCPSMEGPSLQLVDDGDFLHTLNYENSFGFFEDDPKYADYEELKNKVEAKLKAVQDMEICD